MSPPSAPRRLAACPRKPPLKTMLEEMAPVLRSLKIVDAPPMAGSRARNALRRNTTSSFRPSASNATAPETSQKLDGSGADATPDITLLILPPPYPPTPPSDMYPLLVLVRTGPTPVNPFTKENNRNPLLES